MKDEEIIKEIQTKGFVIIPDLLPLEYINKAKKDLEQAIQIESEQHKSQQKQNHAMVLLCSLYGGSFIDLFDIKPFIRPFELILGEGCIVYAYTSSSMPPHGDNYSSRIHVDCPRIIPNYITNLGGIALLDDFTEENGATWMLPYSQQKSEAPSANDFYSSAERMTAKAGSAIYFNARIWHAGGGNKTDKWRHALTINMARPWMKQRLDIPRAMNEKKLSIHSEKAEQKLGFHSQVPASYEEYYLPPNQRKFKQKVE